MEEKQMIKTAEMLARVYTRTHGNLIDKKQSMKNALLNIYARDG